MVRALWLGALGLSLGVNNKVIHHAMEVVWNCREIGNAIFWGSAGFVFSGRKEGVRSLQAV